MIIAGIPDAVTGGNLGTLFSSIQCIAYTHVPYLANLLFSVTTSLLGRLMVKGLRDNIDMLFGLHFMMQGGYLCSNLLPK